MYHSWSNPKFGHKEDYIMTKVWFMECVLKKKRLSELTYELK
jgi:hypothetical protein